MIMKCASCRQRFELRDYNLLRICVPCPVCGRLVSFSASATLVYGRAIGNIVAERIKNLSQVRLKKESLAQLVALAYLAIERLVRDALVEKKS